MYVYPRRAGGGSKPKRNPQKSGGGSKRGRRVVGEEVGKVVQPQKAGGGSKRKRSRRVVSEEV
eukprot:CAMPEP_0194065076 /NCGR_PEP_ID=MMETSP0009_2-20130614/84767_1 /TAXON_ID=210454 /ORGANISM="Grammatophora oceanica, Strain CCMP 410" /LENGTH=62 /DNA_ID=CAMNT_0038717803 /DNA_START=262 /DNA_END=450 /DNA_ORIENTATION=-